MPVNLSAVTNDISMEQGASVEIPFTVARNAVPLDLTNYTVNMQVRRSFADTAVLINCTIANAKIVFSNRVGGAFKLTLAPADTSAVRFTADELSNGQLTGVYDLEIQNLTNGVVFKAAKGTFSINREVTRV